MVKENYEAQRSSNRQNVVAEKTFNRYMPHGRFLSSLRSRDYCETVFGTFSYEGERYDIYGHMRDNTKGFVVNLFMNNTCELSL